jgi:cation:H+ antiporter
MSYLGFTLCALIIFLAGSRLSRYGDMLAELTGMGKAWIGLILMAAVTSLPELMVGISSAAIVGSADLAVGDIFGSCAFNLLLLSVLDAFMPRDKPLLGTSSPGHVLAATLGAILVAMAGLGILLPNDIDLLPSIGITSLSFMVVYLIAMAMLYKFNKKRKSSDEENTSAVPAHMTLRKVIMLYALAATVVVAAALALPSFASDIAKQTGLGESFVGTLFLAVSTSLPEIAVSLAAIRMGSADMAVGNLLGSNIFNIFILFIDDLVYSGDHLLKDASDNHAISAFAVIIMSCIAIIGLTFRSQHKRFLMAYDALLIFVVYVLNLVILYNMEQS